MVKTVNFAGRTWRVFNSDTRTGAGMNFWSSDNVFVDSNGYLHLKIKYQNNMWLCAEVSSEPLGYGSYFWTTRTNLADIDKNVIAALFCYKDDAHEVDIEYTGWGSLIPSICDLSVQPQPSIYKRIVVPENVELTHYIKWFKEGITIGVALGKYGPNDVIPENKIISNFVSGQQRDATGIVADMNLWLFKGSPPSNYRDTELVITDFKFVPA